MHSFNKRVSKNCLNIFIKQLKFSIEYDFGVFFYVSKQKFLHVLYRSTLLELVIGNSSKMFNQLPSKGYQTFSLSLNSYQKNKENKQLVRPKHWMLCRLI